MSASDRTAGDEAIRQCDLSVVVPVYNSEHTVAELHTRLRDVLDALGRSFEIILVDDGSRDASWSAIEAAARRDDHVVGVRLSRNLGQGNATIVGLGLARGACVATLDDDLQHPPEELPILLATLESQPGLDAVFAAPLSRRHDWWRRAASWSLNLLASAVLVKSPFLRFSAFRIMRRPVSQWLASQRMHRPILAALLLRHTRRVAPVRTHHDRSSGASRFGLGELVLVWVGYFQALDPLRLRLVAAVSTLFLLACGWRVAHLLLVGHSAMDWTAVAAAVTWGIGIALSGPVALGSIACIRHSRSTLSLAPPAAAIAAMIARGAEITDLQPISGAASVVSRKGQA